MYENCTLVNLLHENLLLLQLYASSRMNNETQISQPEPGLNSSLSHYSCIVFNQLSFCNLIQWKHGVATSASHDVLNISLTSLSKTYVVIFIYEKGQVSMSVSFVLTCLKRDFSTRSCHLHLWVTFICVSEWSSESLATDECFEVIVSL